MYQDSILIENAEILNTYNNYFYNTWNKNNILIPQTEIIEEHNQNISQIHQYNNLSQDTLKKIVNILQIEYELPKEDIILITQTYQDISEFLLQSKYYNQINNIGYATIFNESQTYNQFQQIYNKKYF